MAAWKKYRFGDFLRRVKLPITIQDSESYKRVTIKTAHGGVSVRDYEVGKKIGTKKQFLLKEGLFVMSKIDARHGAFGIAGNDVDGAIITGNFWAYEFDKEVISIDWLNNFTNSPVFYDICERSSSGITHRKYLDEKKFLNNEIWLPSIGEQYRIIDSFKQRQEIFRSVRSELTHQQTLLKKLRQQILQEAIEGKLTANWRAQNPDVEPASELLKRIAAEKAQLVKDKKIKAQKPLPPITDEEKPFELPQGWEWCRLEQILVVLLGGYAFKSPLFKKSGTKQVLRLGNIRPYTLRLDEKPVYIDNEYAKEAESVKLRPGDVLITMTGTRGKRDYCYTVLLEEKDFQSSELYLNQRVGCLRFSPNIIKKYYDYCLKDDRLLDQIFSTATGAANQANIGSNTLRSWLVPLPPIEEQQTIVTKVEKLLALCDQLETQITQNQHHAAQLMQAVLKEAFSHNSEVAPAVTKSKVSADTPEVAGA